MTPIEQQYRKTVNAIAFSLLIFLAAMMVQSVIQGLLPLFGPLLSQVAYNVMSELVGALLYAVTFCLTVLFFYKVFSTTPTEPIKTELKLPRETPLYLFFGIAVVSAAAYVGESNGQTAWAQAVANLTAVGVMPRNWDDVEAVLTRSGAAELLANAIGLVSSR